MKTSFEFNAANWMTDPSLRSCSVGARGFFMAMICAHAEGVDVASMSVEALSIELGCELPELQGYLDELTAAGLYPDLPAASARFTG